MRTTRLRSGFGLAEAPRWRNGCLWLSDIGGRRIWCLSAAGDVLEEIETPGRPSGLGWLPNGDLLAVMMDERCVLRRSHGQWRTHADVGDLTEGPLNDMVVSRVGNAYVTGLGEPVESTERRSTRIVLVRPDGRAEVQMGDVWRPNGCVLTPDERRLIVAETRVHRLTEFELAADGTIVGKRTFADLPSGYWADGISLDVDGAVWVADPKGKRCVRVTPSGELVDVIDTAPLSCIACTLGGDDLQTLFLLVGELGDFEELGIRRPSQVLATRVDVPGTASP